MNERDGFAPAIAMYGFRAPGCRYLRHGEYSAPDVRFPRAGLPPSPARSLVSRWTACWERYRQMDARRRSACVKRTPAGMAWRI